MADRLDEIRKRVACGWRETHEDTVWLTAEIERLRDRLEAVKLASKTNLDEDLIEGVRGLAAVFDEHMRVREVLGLRSDEDPVAAVERLIDEVARLRAVLAEPTEEEARRLVHLVACTNTLARTAEDRADCAEMHCPHRPVGCDWRAALEREGLRAIGAGTTPGTPRAKPWRRR